MKKMISGKIISGAMLLLALLFSTGQIFADATPGKLTNTAGRRVLLLYNGDVPHNQTTIMGYQAFYYMLTTTYGFNVEVLNVPRAFNKGVAGLTWSNAASYVTRAANAITPANYCIIFDMRFANDNIMSGSGARGTNYIQGDTITRNDALQYQAYLAAGGALMISGDNYYYASITSYDGFISRQEKMMDALNLLLAGTDQISSDTCFQVGPPFDSLDPAGINWSLLETDYNTLPVGVTGHDYSGYLPASCLTANAHKWAVLTSDHNYATGIAWGEPGLASANANAKLIYFADNSVLNNGVGGVGMGIWRYMENAVDYLHNDTCCTPPSVLCLGGPMVNDPADNPIISCFQAGANGYTTGSWTNTWDINNTGGGSLMTNFNGTWDQLLFDRTITSADVVTYDQLCFSIRNTSSSSVTIKIWNQNFGASFVPNVVVAANSTYTGCQTIDSAVAGVATTIRFLVNGTSPSSGAAYLDGVYMRHSCGTQPYVIDSACCIVTYTPTNTPAVSFTPTNTPTRTYTPANTYTFTHTFTNTYTATPTNTVMMQITKSIDKTVVTLGETVRYCFDYTNPSSSPISLNLWDTIPGVTDFINCTNGCSTATFGSNFVVSWNLTVAGSGSQQVCFSVLVAHLPFYDPWEEYFAALDRQGIMRDFEAGIENEKGFYMLARMSAATRQD